MVAACSAGDTLLVEAGTFPPLAIAKSLTVLGGWSAGFAPATRSSPRPSAVARRRAGAAPHGERPQHRARWFHAPRRQRRPADDAGAGDLSRGRRPAGLRSRRHPAALRLREQRGGHSGTAGVGGGGLLLARAGHARALPGAQQPRRAGGGALLPEERRTPGRASIDSNDAGGTGRGAGVAAFDSRLEWRSGAVRGNRGARDGGGLDLESCPQVQCTGLVLDGNQAARQGGGVASRNSSLAFAAAGSPATRPASTAAASTRRVTRCAWSRASAPPTQPATSAAACISPGAWPRS